MSDLPMGSYPRVGYNVSWFQAGAVRVVLVAVTLNVVVFFVNAFIIKGGCISPKQAGEVERAGDNVLAFV
jgi:hypothetical protein